MAREWVTVSDTLFKKTATHCIIRMQYDANEISTSRVAVRLVAYANPDAQLHTFLNLSNNIYVLMNPNKVTNVHNGAMTCARVGKQNYNDADIFYIYKKPDYYSNTYKNPAFSKTFGIPDFWLCILESQTKRYTNPTDLKTDFTAPTGNNQKLKFFAENVPIETSQTVALPLTPDIGYQIYIVDNGNNSFAVRGGVGYNSRCTNNSIVRGDAAITISGVGGYSLSLSSDFNITVSAGTKETASTYYINPGTGTLNTLYEMTSTKLASYLKSYFTVKATLTITDKYGNTYECDSGSKNITIHKAPNPLPSNPYLDMSILKHPTRLTLKENYWTFKWSLPRDYDTDASRYITANGSRLMGQIVRLMRKRGDTWAPVPIVDPTKVAAGKTGSDAYYDGIVVNQTNKFIYLPADTTKINVYPNSVDNSTGFEPGDLVTIQVSTYSRYGADFTGNINSLISSKAEANSKLVQNAAVVQARDSDTWEEGIVHVYQDGKWIEAEAVSVYTADGEWVEST